eukprot:CAMPEP_0173416140 /NCGR_PEP_ID=MMETSP1356-20130122/85238_1 /TAXON_ID=77927 ORGANISM="Hemiselmis virescens, Strain PCC157" /NCGR_SAMPLE_ID=MMETSP1356 /ASSEMBLY_ACC=CAM_ASM_000847 /LENGTH=123 /DNA_ID=CAMNT_0014378441 /DNA_START=30 /DNA_END=401 /DNA_ORIENTATION=-
MRDIKVELPRPYPLTPVRHVLLLLLAPVRVPLEVPVQYRTAHAHPQHDQQGVGSRAQEVAEHRHPQQHKGSPRARARPDHCDGKENKANGRKDGDEEDYHPARPLPHPLVRQPQEREHVTQRR